MKRFKPNLHSIISLATTMSFIAIPACTNAWGQSSTNLPLVVGAAPRYEPIPLPAPQPASQSAPQAALQPALQPAQEEVDAQADQLSAQELRDIVGPIALYPDPLLAQVLAAATYPLDIVQASRFVKANAKDPALNEKIDAQQWDTSVQAVARYPDVLALMDENLEWTQNLGAAFLYQQADLMAAVQELRAQAQAAGNLASGKEQVVVSGQGENNATIIQILPADPQVIYVPVYEPEYVYIERQPTYFGPILSFSIGYSVGRWLDLDCDWRHRHVYHGGWYGHHHHDARPRVVHTQNTVVIHNGAHGYRVENNNDRRDDRDQRDNRDQRDQRDNRDQRQSVWKHNDAKPAPQRRPTGDSSRIVTNTRTGSAVNSRTDDVNRSGRATVPERTGPVSRSDATVRSDAPERSEGYRHTFRPTPGVVRSTPGVSRTDAGVSRNVPAPVITNDTNRRQPVERVRPVMPNEVDANTTQSPRFDHTERTERTVDRSDTDRNEIGRRAPVDRVQVPPVISPQVQVPRAETPRIVTPRTDRSENTPQPEISKRQPPVEREQPKFNDSIKRTSSSRVIGPQVTPPRVEPRVAPTRSSESSRSTPAASESSRPARETKSSDSTPRSESRSSSKNSDSSKSSGSRVKGGGR